MLTGLRDRLERELTNTAPHTAKVKVTSPSNALERRFSTWIGETQGWSTQYCSGSVPVAVELYNLLAALMYMQSVKASGLQSALSLGRH